MTLTVEPGCYVRPAESVPERFWNIGVRIEDDALVTATGCEILTAGAPKLVGEVEALMRDAHPPSSKGVQSAAKRGISKGVRSAARRGTPKGTRSTAKRGIS
jgi:hypothetical protein